MRMKILTCGIALMATIATLSCTREPVRETISQDCTHQQVAQ